MVDSIEFERVSVVTSFNCRVNYEVVLLLDGNRFIYYHIPHCAHQQ